MSLTISVLMLFILNSKTVRAINGCVDDFNLKRTCTWQEIKDAKSSWSIENGKLTGWTKFFQTEGSIYYLAQNITGNYSIEADVTSISGVDKTIVGRFQDIQNYYALNLRSSFNGSQGNDLLLVKHCCQGLRKTLQKVAFENEFGNTYRLRIDFNGPEIKAFVNNKLLLQYTDTVNFDPPLLTGAPGLSIWGGNWNENSGAKYTEVAFDNVSITSLIPKRVFIIIPGFGGSLDLPSLLSCRLETTSKEWTLAPYAKVYDRLIGTFAKNGFQQEADYYVYAYDWRQTMPVQADLLKFFLDSKIKETQSELNFIAHSLGGLVVRSFLDKYGNKYNINKVITLGSPHLGTPLAYPIWEGGLVEYNDKTIKLAIDTLLNYCQMKLAKDDKSTIQALIPSMKDLFPVFPFLVNDMNELIPVSEMQNQNLWLQNLNASPNNFVTTTISGNNISTLESIKIDNADAGDIWPDGKPIENINTQAGDGTILLKSAVLPNFDSIVIDNQNHAQIVYSDQSLNLLFPKLDLQNINLANEESANDIRIKSTPTTIERLQNQAFRWKRYQLKIK